MKDLDGNRVVSTERPLTPKGARALARLIRDAPSATSAPDARPLARYVLTLNRKRKRT